MPNRILRDYRDSMTMANLTDFEERLFVRMIMTADDFGRGLANNLHATCFQVSDIPRATCMQAANVLHSVGLIRLYSDQEGRTYYDIPKFGNKPRATHSKCPPYDDCKHVACKLLATCSPKPITDNREPKTETEDRKPETEDREPGTDSCAEPGNTRSTPPDESPVVLTFACTGSVPQWNLTQKRVDEWETAFPELDIMAECRKAKAWEDSNGKNRKTASGKARFLFSWLSRAQNSGGRGGSNQTPRQPGGMNSERVFDAAKHKAFMDERIKRDLFGETDV